MARPGRQVLGDVVQPRPTRMHDEDLRSPCCGLADPQMQDRYLLLRIEARQQDHGRVLDVGIRHRSRAIGDGRRGDDLGQPAVERAAMIQVVRPDHRAGELRQRVVVLVHQTTAGEERHTPGPAPLGEPREDLAERSGLQPAIADQRRRDPSGGVGMAIREPAFVADPRVVHVGVLPGEHAHDLAATDIDADVAPRAAVLAHGIAGGEVERSGDEPVRRRGERPDRADLDRVAAEGRAEVLPGGDRDPLPRAPGEQLEEPVAADLVAEPRAPGAQDAPLAVQTDQRRERNRLREDALRIDESALAGTEGERLILQRALTAAVADGAIERVVEEQELEVRDLRLSGGIARVLGAHDHPGSDRDRAGGLQLRLPLHLDVALAAGPGRREVRVIAEPGDLDAKLLGRSDDERRLRNGHLFVVDRERDGLLGHQADTSSRCSTLNGHPPRRTCSSYSSGKCCRLELMTDAVPSASAQNARNIRFVPRSRMIGRSAS